MFRSTNGSSTGSVPINSRSSIPPGRISDEINRSLERVFLHLAMAEGIHKNGSKGNGPKIPEAVPKEKGVEWAPDEHENKKRLIEHVNKGNTAAARMLLIELDANLKDVNGWPLITLASHRGDLEMAKLLVSRGARVDEPNPWGWTGLMFAALNGHIEIAEFLLEQGADPSVNDKNGFNARKIAEDNGHAGLAGLIRTYEKA